MTLRTNGSRIRELRERQAMTLVEFAQRLGYTMNHVHLIEVGKANGGPKFIRRATDVLDCNIEDIATHTSQRKRA